MLCEIKTDDGPQTTDDSTKPWSMVYGLWSTSAFTLIEIMITTAVLALLITGIYSIFKGGTDSWTKGNVRMERYQNARAILEMMSREISCAMVNEARKIYMLGVDKSESGKVKDDVRSTADELFFIAPVYPMSDIKDSSNTTKSDMCELGYWVKDDTELIKHRQVSNLDFIFQSDIDATNNHSLGIAVADLRFYYYGDDGCDDEDSHVNWGSNDSDADTYLYKLPKKIKIVLKTRDEEAREDTQTFETTVFMPGAE
ncbi:MAG: prepilin-type N-terminal cleavage/methylation domain-containing protein [bacterium]|nr:prepilin-type N-terminal cleavage/methylation domain-containing protein [bacterium]